MEATQWIATIVLSNALCKKSWRFSLWCSSLLSLLFGRVNSKAVPQSQSLVCSGWCHSAAIWWHGQVENSSSVAYGKHREKWVHHMQSHLLSNNFKNWSNQEEADKQINQKSSPTSSVTLVMLGYFQMISWLWAKPWLDTSSLYSLDHKIEQTWNKQKQCHEVMAIGKEPQRKLHYELPVCYLRFCVNTVDARPGGDVPETNVTVSGASTTGQQTGLPGAPGQGL